MQKSRIRIDCDQCTTAITWSGLAGPDPFDVDQALDALGWTTYGQGRHRCDRCTARAESWSLDAVAWPDLDLGSLGELRV